MADKNYKLDFWLTDGTTKSVTFTAPQGPQGDTPVKGTDYWTDADKEEMVEELAAQADSTPTSGSKKMITSGSKKMITSGGAYTALAGKASSSHTHDPADLSAGTFTKSIYLNTHPENSPLILPFLYNDLAFLTKKGGSCTIYATTDTDYTVATLTNQTTVSVSSVDNMFDGSPSYAICSTTGQFTLVIDLVLHKTFNYSNFFYIDFGSTSWRAKDIAVYVMNSAYDTVYAKQLSTTGRDYGNYHGLVSYTTTDTSGNTSYSFDRLRIVLSNFNMTTSGSGKRISQIGLINYGSSGASETYLSRGGCSGIYGSLIPNTTNGLDLGSSAKKWRNVYATTFTGALSGNADTATRAVAVPYGTCATAADTVPKTVTASTFSLITGARVTVKFTYENTASAPTLNVNSTGAKAIYWHGSALPDTQYWDAGSVLDFVYNGTQWELVNSAKGVGITSIEIEEA